MLVLFHLLYNTVGTVCDFLINKLKNRFVDSKHVLTEAEIFEVITHTSEESGDKFDRSDADSVAGSEVSETSTLPKFEDIETVTPPDDSSEILNDTHEDFGINNEFMTSRFHMHRNDFCNTIQNNPEFEQNDDLAEDIFNFMDVEDDVAMDAILDDVENPILAENFEFDCAESEPTEIDREQVLSFDPPVYFQRYSVVNQRLIDCQGEIRKIADFGCAEFGFFKFAKKISGVEEIYFVDIDQEMLKRCDTRLYPLNYDYLFARKGKLSVWTFHGSVAHPSVEMMNVDAVVCIEL